MPFRKGDIAWLWLKRYRYAFNDSDFQRRSYREMLEERTASVPDFPEQLRRVALEAIVEEDVVWIRSGLRALMEVGKACDVPFVESLREHSDPEVVKDAGTCLFELRRTG